MDNDKITLNEYSKDFSEIVINGLLDILNLDANAPIKNLNLNTYVRNEHATIKEALWRDLNIIKNIYNHPSPTEKGTNPVTIFEFKKPQRDDFVNPSSKEDPVQQIVRYVNSIKEGDYKTPKGKKIMVAENTPFYGYVVCDLTSKVEKWLETEKDFKSMPDGLGWFRWYIYNQTGLTDEQALETSGNLIAA